MEIVSGVPLGGEQYNWCDMEDNIQWKLVLLMIQYVGSISMKKIIKNILDIVIHPHIHILYVQERLAENSEIIKWKWICPGKIDQVCKVAVAIISEKTILELENTDLAQWMVNSMGTSLGPKILYCIEGS